MDAAQCAQPLSAPTTSSAFHSIQWAEPWKGAFVSKGAKGAMLARENK